jgi:hypothetical protein
MPIDEVISQVEQAVLAAAKRAEAAADDNNAGMIGVWSGAVSTLCEALHKLRDAYAV